jgi:hypothetical protein
MNEAPPFTVERFEPKAKRGQKSGLKFTLFRDINAAPRKEFLVAGLLGVGEASGFAGAPGSGKSVLAGDLGFHVAAGLPWLNRRAKQGGVIYIAAERAALTARRFAALRKRYGVDNPPLAIVSGPVDFLTNKAHVDECAGHAERLQELFAMPVALIVVDTVSRVLAGGDENSPKDMGALVANIGRLQDATGAHVLLLHHVPQTDGAVRLRGHGALLGALDTVIAVEKGVTVRTATVTKDNDGAGETSIAFTLQSVTLSIDQDTKEETAAPVVVAAEQPIQQPKAAVKAKLPAAATVALKALAEAIADQGIIPPASNHIPPSVRAVTIDQWKDRAIKKGLSNSDDRKAQAKTFRRSVETLLAAQRVGTWDPHVWLA